jgi:hypothetical protein
MPKPGSTTARGYGAKHQAERKRWAKELARLGVLPCARCGEPIHDGDEWDLGHTDDRTGYTGPEHSGRCNRADGGRRRHAPRAHARRIL